MDEDPDVRTFVFCHAPLAGHDEAVDDWTTGRTSAQSVTLNHPSVRRIPERGTSVVIVVDTGHRYGVEERRSKRVSGIEYVTARHPVRGHDPDYAGDARWLRVDEASRTAEVRYYGVGADEGSIVTATR